MKRHGVNFAWVRKNWKKGDLMFRTILFAMSLTLGAYGAGTLWAEAQTSGTAEMTQAEIEAAFAAQRTRGLVIAPAGQPEVEAEAPTTQVAYDGIPPEEQVNIHIAFDFDSAALREDQKPKLVALCNAMKSAEEVQLFRVLGHTDSVGSAAYNERLSLLRAEEVKRHLVDDCGISEQRLEAVGVGMRHPYDPDDPRADVNRRVEFQVAG
jgi:OmpA-OmpF porin, OOP family